MIDGFINLHKPATWTSHDCVARTRRLLGTKKVGHGGTLDPLATGVLPIAVGRATRLLQYLPTRKAYRALIRFGVTTTTDDLEGEIVTQQSADHLQRSEIAAVLPQFTGVLNQTPPMYSAIQVEGKRLYDLARKGKTVDVPTRQVSIYQIKLGDWRDNPQSSAQPELSLDVACGPGTYVRSLARDLGAALGTGATLAGLVRTHSSGFNLAESITLEALEAAIAQETFAPYPAAKAVEHLQAIALPASLALRWRMGQKLALTEAGIMGLTDEQKMTRSLDDTLNDIADISSEPLRVLEATTNTFLGIGEIRTVPSMAGPTLPPGNILVSKMVFLPV